MAGSVNKVTLVGNLGKDPEARSMNNGGEVVSFTLATSETWNDRDGNKQEKTEWHNVVIFNENLGKVAKNYLRKGQKAYIEGQLQTRKWTDQSGVEKYSTEIVLQGFNSVLYGFIAIGIFMCAYYLLFGVFSTVALAFNLLLLVAVLSMLQATLTLPGMAAMALALGMAIDSNVLINERVREELRSGANPQAAIHAGYDRAWATILDSNITTLIAGVALLAFGSGPVRGFAVVHCIGILTSMFSAVFFSRGLVNLWYGRQKRLQSVRIGTVWRPDLSVVAHKD